MEQDQIEPRILSIECAVGDGGVAVLAGASVLASTAGSTTKPSRAEEVIGAVGATLAKAGLALTDIDRIAVSRGPGSYSGIRIGMATALGLGKALSIDPVGVSTLDALALASIVDTDLVTAVAVGKRHAAWCRYQVVHDTPQPISSPVLEADDDFIQNVALLPTPTMIWSDELAMRLTEALPKGLAARAPERSLAELIGLYAARFPGAASLEPLYLREQQVASS
jgi:tRNA threonylcarbamoyladenosine biosynthesis protein TsaB